MMPPLWNQLSVGASTGMSIANEFEVRVQGFHCDLYGHVNNARYLEFLEAARWETLDCCLDIGEFHRRGWTFVVVRVEIDYRRPATLGDLLAVATWREEIGRSSARVRQEVRAREDGKLVAEALVSFVVVDQERGRPLRLRGDLKEQLERLPEEGSKE
jgi:thioesterase III